MLRDTDKEEIRKHFKIPPHIEACASAIRYDLLHGPSWSRIPGGNIEKFTVDHYATFYADLEEDKREGDVIEETYVGTVAKTLKGFLDDLPSESYYNTFGGEFSEKEPEGEQEEETGDYIEPNWDDWYKLDHRDLVEILFGKTIAREFR